MIPIISVKTFFRKTIHQVRKRFAGAEKRKEKNSQAVVLLRLEEKQPVVSKLLRKVIQKVRKRKSSEESDSRRLQELIATLPPLMLSHAEKANQTASFFTPEADLKVNKGDGRIPADKLNIVVRPGVRPVPVGIVKMLDLLNQSVRSC
ncbi:MAG TPA: hypothetical protein VNZ86_19665 [Bacteroidia bacterium]|jgi:hypothetical protein|nr:hypothetical protein [Bacteroidia bacterium]